MDDVHGGLDPDYIMDMDEGEGSDLEDEEEDLIDEPLPSPLQLPSSGPASTATSTASSPPTNDDVSTPFPFSGKPLSIKRGRGRPRREGGKPAQRRSGLGVKLKRWRPPGYSRGMPKRVRGFDRGDIEFSAYAIGDDGSILDPETGALILPDKDKLLPTPEDSPYPPEQWPGKVCAFCNLGGRSQLGQGEMLRLTCPEGFTPQRTTPQNIDVQPIVRTPERDAGDKSPRGPVTCRRQKSFNKCRHPSLTSEYVDELTIIGHIDEPEVQVIFEQSGHFYVHINCARWSDRVVKNENSTLENVGPVALQSTSRKCTHCNHFGASVTCRMDLCSKIYHFPCATASGAFQESGSLTTYCSAHLGQVSLVCESSVCYTCKMQGDIANLMFCSACGEHYHGTCVGLAQLPGVRAGWQCRKCRICQVCRMIGDENKLMACEQCDKVYHSMCQRPIVTTIPKYGWKCRCCRVCGDCGSRTPGAGLSSRWHAHYTVCDSCYQQRNKGFSCPLCHRAYRAHAYREMVQCALCRKFVHGTCDPDADLVNYHQRKESHPEYEYVCLICKSLTQQGRQLIAKRSSIEEGGESLSASQESLLDDSLEYDFDRPMIDEGVRSIGLGKGKPYSASKIAKKRLGLGTGLPGRPKGVGKALPGKVGFMKRQRITEFGRKRGPKSKMRGIFGVPGVGLQRPVGDGSKNDEEPGVENRLVLCSAKDKFVLTQDICVMCGALGTDQEGCLIACVQCGQCYHPYCVSVKVTKMILQKGWRCLDCTVCEGCGQRNDEGRLILCDECDISYHIYCMDPPLDYVPHGNWKCKWCAICQSCGASDPGFNCTWMNSFSECGPCASHATCPSCMDTYNEGDLIIQCVQCERWLHAGCDMIKNEIEAEKCAEEGYNCILCRPRDVPPPHLLPTPTPKPPTPTKSPEVKSNSSYYLDGIYLSEMGHNLIKSLSLQQHMTRKKRKKIIAFQDKEAGIMATIESVVAGSRDGFDKLELMDVKEEPQDIYKEGMLWTKEDGPPPDGFTLYTMESGVTVLRRKRQRNLQKLGIGGFLVRVRGIRSSQDNDDVDMLPGQTTPTIVEPSTSQPILDCEKPRRKPARRKPKSKLAESFPPYLQEAFFGRELLDAKEADTTSGSDDENAKNYKDKDKTLHLSQDEIKAVAAISAKQEKSEMQPKLASSRHIQSFTHKANSGTIIPKEEDESDTEALKDVLTLPGDLLDTDLVNTIMNEDDDELTKNADTLESLTDSNLPDDSDIGDSLGNTGNTKDTKDELTDILGSHFNIESIPNINSKDVEDIFKGVLTDESQESQESNAFPLSTTSSFGANVQQQQQQSTLAHSINAPVRPTTLSNLNQASLNSPMSFPPQSPYHSEYSNSPQFSPAFSEPPSPWVSVNDSNDLDAQTAIVPSTYNQRSSEKMKADEGLGSGATISAVLYANMNHPEWKSEFPTWNDRYKQIIKKWRTLSTEQKAPYLQQARDNRSALRMKKQQQDQEKIAQQQKSAREAEQERQWKQLQALRQQQAQQQQHVLHEQRAQDGGQQFLPEQVGVAQVTTSQELSPNASPSPTTPQVFPCDTKGAQSPLSNKSASIIIHPSTHSDSTNVFPTSASTNSDLRATTTTNNPLSHAQPKLSADPAAHLPSASKLQFTLPRTTLQGYAQIRPGEGLDMNHQLRDLLQRQQQFKKLDEQLLLGKGQQRVWPPADATQEQEQSNITQSDAMFRHPLPPAVVRPRVPAPTGGLLLRQPNAVIGLKVPGDARMQGVDPRMRLLIQQHQQRGLVPANLQQQFQSGTPPRFPQPAMGRTLSNEQYEHLLQKQVQFSARPTDQSSTPTSAATPQTVPGGQTAVPSTTTAASDNNSNDQEIPDNVTAELEKLEQETGTMVELHGVSDILGGLGDDDDELLAEMGADFNILEYADPELDSLTAGEKTNILDSLDLVEPEPVKDDKKNSRISNLPKPVTPQTTTAVTVSSGKTIKTEPMGVRVATSTAPGTLQPPPLAVSQPQSIMSTQAPTLGQAQITPQQQMHQQMLQQVQQAAAMGRPMAPGTKLMSPDGVIGVVTPNNTVSLTFPSNYAQRMINSHIQFQHQKLQMRMGGIQGPRMLSAAPGGPTLHSGIVGVGSPARMNLAPPPPPPPPPYPGPPPPYPGSSSQEQPLLLEDLLEQEKREQEKQLQSQTSGNTQDNSSTSGNSVLLSDHDFERIKADVFNTNNLALQSSQSQGLPAQGLLPSPNLPGNQVRPNFPPRVTTPTAAVNQWQQSPARTAPISTQQTAAEVPPRVPTFNATLLPAPPLPPENIVTEQDRQSQLVYEQWLNNQNTILSQQLKYYETEVQKLRKVRKSLNSKQRQLRKSGNQLAEADAMELQRISAEQAILQKHLESSRKQSRQHGMLIQEYRNKQQVKQRPGPGQSPLLPGQQSHSPLGPPVSSPIHHANTPQSPMISPSASPMMVQHNSPLQSPRPLVSHSPGPNSMSGVIQSPNSTSGSNVSPMQPSRIGTPHSQGEGSPGSVQSPSQVCLPPPAPRMTSPQHRRVVTSPVGYIPDLRQANQQPRFVRLPLNDQQTRIRLSSPNQNFHQKPNTPSPLNSPPPQQMTLTQQQIVQRQLQQQLLQQSADSGQLQTDGNVLHTQRAMQMMQQRQLVMQQRQLLQQQQQQQQGSVQPQTLTPQQHQMMLQQQQQLAKQQQQQIAQMQLQSQVNRITTQPMNNQPPNSPMPPRSPMLNQNQQIMSPHSVQSQPTSPMPPRSPMINLCNQPPSSPMARSPALHQNLNQPPNSPMVVHHSVSSPHPRSPIVVSAQSPMGIRRPPSTNSSPAMPDRPLSVENPGTPRTLYTPQSYIDTSNIIDNDQSGGGNPHNPNNPLPLPPMFGKFGYIKLGLRGGSPMWNFSRGAKRIPIPPDHKDDKAGPSEPPGPPKVKKESHLSKVSILKKKSPAKTNLQSLAISKVGSLVSSDYNEFDDSSCTPPVTPPPMASTSRIAMHKGFGKRIPDHVKEQLMIIDHSPDRKQMQCGDIIDYDDDNDNTLVSTEVTLSSAAQQDGDDITVIETFSQSDLADVMSSPLESDQITDEFLLFPGNMVVDISGEAQYSDKEDDEEEEYTEELVDISDKNMQIVAIQSPTTSEEELIMQGKTKKITSDGLTLNIVQGLSSEHLLTVSDTPDSPEQEELNVDPSPEHYSQPTDEEILANLEDSEIVIIDPTIKSPEEQISTKEDFEELIDEGTRKELLRQEVINTKHITEIHKYAANVLSCPPKTVSHSLGVRQQTNASIISNIARSSGAHVVTPHIINTRTGSNLVGQKISIVTAASSGTTTTIGSPIRTHAAKLVSDVVVTQTTKLTTSASNITNIILPIKTTVRSNIINVPKLVTSVSPAITIVSASTSHITSMLPSRFTIPVISASVVNKLPNVTVIDKPSSSSLSLTPHDSCVPKKIFDDESVSPDSSTYEEEKSKQELAEEKSKQPVASVPEISLIAVSTNANTLKKKIEMESSHMIKKPTESAMEHVKLVRGNSVKIEKAPVEVKEKISDFIDPKTNKEMSVKKFENVQISNVIVKEQIQKLPTPLVSKTSSPIIVQSGPELKMTAQIVQEKQTNLQIPVRPVETISASFITSQSIETLDVNTDVDADTKSVVISIPSPTPSQEQMLDNMTLQALENRRRDGKGMSGEFDSFEDVLDMIENITGEPPTVLEENIKDKIKLDEAKNIATCTKIVDEKKSILQTTDQSSENKIHHKVIETTTATPSPVVISTAARPAVTPQLSPLSQPTELTTNVANVSQQLRTLLSSLHTTTVTTSSNVATVVKSVAHKDRVVNPSLATAASVLASRIIQPTGRMSPVISTASIILPNMKQKVASSLASTANSATTFKVSIPSTAQPHSTTSISISNIPTSSAALTSNSTSMTNLLGTRSSTGIQLMPDHPKLPPVTTVTLAHSSALNVSQIPVLKQTSVITSAVPATSLPTQTVRKPSLSLNAMLQSHPAATMAQTAPGTITTASILGSPITISRSAFSPSLVHAQPHVVSVATTTYSISSASSSSTPTSTTVTSLQTSSSSVIPRPMVTTTNLLHTQLTKSTLVKTKSTDELPSVNEMLKKEDIKLEPCDNSTSSDGLTQTSTSTNTVFKQEIVSGSGCKFSAIQGPATKVEDSQNVLLKQLLQNTACASSTLTQTTTTTTSSFATTAPSLPIVPNLEAQLARPVPPTPTTLLPPLLQNDSPLTHSPKVTQQRIPIVTRETSFVSKPVQPPTPTTVSASQLLHIDIKKCLPPSRTPSRDELLSPPTPKSSCSQDSSLQTPPLVIKKEPSLAPPQQSPILQEVKKEFIDDSSQHSEVSDHSRSDIQMKEELDSLDVTTEKTTLEQKEELKKLKRRAYQQKRRQNQILNKEAAGQPKKRPRKGSKVDEDYDTYIDGVLAQLRTLPPMVVQEPLLGRNFGVVPVFGSGELLKLGTKDYDSRYGDLMGSYGNASVPGYADFYSAKPYGDAEPLPEKPPASTQRGFYDQEFTLVRFDVDEDRKFEQFCRDNDSPDSVISSSSPECAMLESYVKFPGLKLIDDDDEDDYGDEEASSKMRLSPVVPIIAPIPIRLKPVGPYLKDYAEMDKENVGRDYLNVKSKFGATPSIPLKDSGNVTVTLTLTSSAAEDIMGVLRDLANILHIPPPTSYQIVERTSTPPSQKLGLYRTKGKDGKEGVPIDIQSILNGAAKFCKHCDVVILNNMIRKKVSELPFLSKDTELLGDGDELFFCSTACYMQFAIMHRSPSMSEDKAAAIVDHLCQKDKAEVHKKKLFLEKSIKSSGDAFGERKQNSIYFDKIETHFKSDIEVMEMDNLEFNPSCFSKPNEIDRSRKHPSSDSILHMPSKMWKGLKYKYWAPGCIQPSAKFKKPSDKEIMELLYRLGITVTPSRIPEDTRKCMFCLMVGDGVADGPARLLNFDVDKWVHLNCGLWSDGVYETVNGALMNLEGALQQSLVSTCVLCSKLGATIRCFKTRCSSVYHLSCAVKDGCVFYKNKTIYCISHVLKNEKDNELTTLSVSRRVYVNRDENRQVAAVMHHASDTNNLLRVGSLIFLNVGQLLPHQLQNFHTSNYIYPIGYKIVRFYWSMRRLNKRCRYVCSIHDLSGRPEFRVLVQDPPEDDVEFRDSSPKGAWNKILEAVAAMRKENQCVQTFPKYLTGEDLFGLTEPAVVRVLESLPGIETLSDYKFKYGRNPLLELPLAINPSGAARTEPKLRNQFHWKRPHTQRTGSSVRPVFVPTAVGTGEAVCPYSKQFVHSKSSQYKKMKQEWRNNVFLARSKIQGLGLYAARDLEKHTMVIEYIGELIRTELAESREKRYEAKNRGIYMFRLDEDRVIDATLSGGLARYINHSCNPNCVAEIVEVDRDLRIIIFAKRRIQRGEELAYDYKFDIEDDQHKISCMCGAPNCRKWMN